MSLRNRNIYIYAYLFELFKNFRQICQFASYLRAGLVDGDDIELDLAHVYRLSHIELDPLCLSDGALTVTAELQNGHKLWNLTILENLTDWDSGRKDSERL